MYREHKPIHVSPYDHPDIYPGPRPSSSFIYFNGKAHKIIEEDGKPVEELTVKYSKSDQLEGSLKDDGTSNEMTIQDFLDQHELKPISERVPLVGYGSNVCLAQLKYKFGLNKNLNDFVICLRGTMKGSDIVYGSFLAPYGSLPAIIAPVKGAETEIWLTFVDPEQLEHMSSTEGGYELREHTAQKLTLETNETFEKVYAYYYPHALTIDNNWFRFKDIGGDSPLKAEWHSDMLGKLKALADFSGTREQFIHRIRWDWSFFTEIEQLLKAYDETFEHPDWDVPDSIQATKNLKRSF